MAYESSGTLTTDKRTVDESETWSSQTDWEAYQSKTDIEILNGNLQLDSTIPNSVVNRWPIDEGSGTTFADAVGTADGTWNGGTWVSDASYIGDFGYLLDGADDYGDTGATFPAGSMTALATVDFSTDITTISYISSVQLDGDAGSRLFRFTENGTNNFEFTVVNDSKTIYQCEHSLSSTGRYRLGGVLDTSVPEIRVVVNGTVQNTTAVTGSFQTQLSNHTVGRRPDQSSGYYSGEIDEPLVANEAYTATQLTEDYNRQPWS